MELQLRFPGFKRKAVTLSYDDGVKWDKDLMEIMDAHGLKGTFNINSELYAQKEGERRLTAQTAYELYANSNHEVAVHGAKHLHLDKISAAAATRDVLVDRENLEKTYGKIIRGMAYAYGAYNDQVVQILRDCGILYSRTTISTEKFELPTDWLRLPATCHHRHPKLMQLAKDFIEDNENRWDRAFRPKLFYLWGHSYEFNDFDEWHIIREFAEYMGNRDDIFYGTNMEIYNAIEDFRNLVTTTDGTIIYNPSCRDVCAYDKDGDRNVLIKAGETVKL